LDLTSAPSATPPAGGAGGRSPTGTGGSSAAAGSGGATATPPPPAGADAGVASGSVTGTIIPLYTEPTDSSWAAVAAAKVAHPAVPVIAIINPNDGPGASASTSYTGGIAKLVAVGVKVIGYVHTSYGARSASQLEEEIGEYQSWYPQVTGIFFDEMASNPGSESYYAALTAYAKGHGADFTVGNPGTDTASSYLGTEDVMLIYESDGVPAVSTLAGWHATYDRHNFGIIPYAVSSLNTSFVASAKPYVGYIYLQSDNLPNPWDSIPPYLGDLLASLD
jgi:hypothetical protein